MFLLLLEGGVRLAYRFSGKTWPFDPVSLQGQHVYSPYVGWRLLPLQQGNVDAFSATDKLGFLLNEAGDRDLFLKQPGEFRVAIFGGSTVAGHGRHLAAEKTIAQSLEKKMAALFAEQGLQRKVTVINTGVPGYVSAQEFNLFRWYVLPLQPDFVIFFDGSNDFSFYAVPSNGPNDILLQTGVPPYLMQIYDQFNMLFSAEGLLGTVLQRVGLKLAIVDLVYQLGFRSHRVWEHVTALRSDAQTRVLQNQVSVEIDKNVLKHLNAYRGNILSAIGVAREFGIGIACFFQPTITGETPNLTLAEKGFLQSKQNAWHGFDYFEAKAVFVREGKRLFRELGDRYRGTRHIVVADLSAVFDAKSPEKTVYADHVHYTGEGNELIADAILDKIKYDVIQLAGQSAAE